MAHSKPIIHLKDSRNMEVLLLKAKVNLLLPTEVPYSQFCETRD
jgi:hypothetical protein